MHNSKKRKGEILHCVQNDKKHLFVILEEPQATKDLGMQRYPFQGGWTDDAHSGVLSVAEKGFCWPRAERVGYS